MGFVSFVSSCAEKFRELDSNDTEKAPEQQVLFMQEQDAAVNRGLSMILSKYTATKMYRPIKRKW